MACESSEFEIYYFPLDLDFYIPPSREDIMKSNSHIHSTSCSLFRLFELVYNQTGVIPLTEDYGRLRVMIVNKKNNEEIFITADKIILSIQQNKKYSISIEFINNILKEFEINKKING
jgi:intergrase/recombinase